MFSKQLLNIPSGVNPLYIATLTFHAQKINFYALSVLSDGHFGVLLCLVSTKSGTDNDSGVDFLYISLAGLTHAPPSMLQTFAKQ